MNRDQLRPNEREPITGHPIVCPECRQELSLFVAGYCGNERCVLYDAQPWPDYGDAGLTPAREPDTPSKRSCV